MTRGDRNHGKRGAPGRQAEVKDIDCGSGSSLKIATRPSSSQGAISSDALMQAWLSLLGALLGTHL